MSTDERGRGTERCSVHGSAPSVARCDACGRAMCLSCAIPVRGRVLGTECLATALGPEAPVPVVHEPRPGATPRAVALAGFAAAATATVLPWSRFGTGSGPFGAWQARPDWSMVAAIAALVGLAVAVERRLRDRRGRAVDGALLAAALLVVLGSSLAILHPPFATSPWLGPWVSIAGGVTAATATATALARVRGREPAHV